MQDIPARLTAEEVLQLANQALRARHFNMEAYRCDAVTFQPDTPGMSKKWLLHFHREPCVPDEDFFVIVADDTEEVEIAVP
ncbi:MAG: hypothetical protein H7A46_21495 [Verrucomicrobiales bacterium]|nr:hypothetical protein [Verrucomicrobiales bacterium]MCP5524121.1 hypothetical protein [Verrucomicrobiales bacterium]